MTSLEDAISTEIKALHQLLQDWFSGACARSRPEFDARLTHRLADDLVLIPPGGAALTKADLCEGVWNGYAGSPDFRIEIRTVALRPVSLPGHALATYEEWQRNAVNSTPQDNARVASVLFALEHGAPKRWLHIHETWLPAGLTPPERFDF
ncbi:MAG: hypothetical protein AAGF19_04775 [Pseudomonadota bacterium]